MSQIQDVADLAVMDRRAAGDDTERRRVAERERKRWEAFIRVAEGS